MTKGIAHDLTDSIPEALYAVGMGPTTTTGSLAPSPLFLAEVDDVDTTAVLALLAAIPTEDGTGLQVFERRDGGWKAAPQYVKQFNSVDPPTVVELDRPTLLQVVEQLDQSDMGGKKEPVGEESGTESDAEPATGATESEDEPPMGTEG